jgi:MOSC domain-containing protein YiiM
LKCIRSHTRTFNLTHWSKKPIYSYLKEHYEYLHRMFPQIRMLNGIVGNLQLEGLNKGWVNIGKVIRTGYSQISVEPTRISGCFLLILFGLRDTINKCWSSNYSDFYFRDLAEVEVGTKDKIEHGRKHPNEVTIRDSVVGCNQLTRLRNYIDAVTIQSLS